MGFFYQINLTFLFWFVFCFSGVALPDVNEVPEEVLRTEIIIDARSPIDNEHLSPQEYAELQAQLRKSKFSPVLSDGLRHDIFLLNIQKMLRHLNPF